MAALSYDSVEVLRTFADRKGITYPLLSDPDSKIIRAFGILNETVPQGTPFFGVPWPGTFITDARGIVTAKFFEENYRERYTAGNILLRVAPPDPSGWVETATRHLKLRHGASDNTVRGGSRVTLAVEVSLPAKMHVYAPGVQSTYIPISLTLEPPAEAIPHDIVYPPSRTLRLPAIKETVPVYEKTFRLVSDITFPQQNTLLKVAGDSATVAVKGTFRYQACDDKVCYPPVNVPLEWTFHVDRHDSQRAPESMRRK